MTSASIIIQKLCLHRPIKAEFVLIIKRVQISTDKTGYDNAEGHTQTYITLS